MIKMFHTYRIVILMTILSMVLFFCSGSDDGGSQGTQEVFLQCKINGQLRHFNYRANANDGPSGDKVHFVVISGWEGDDMATSPRFGINMVLPEGATETTYIASGGLEPELDGKYFYQNYVNGQNVGTTVYSGGISEGTHFKLTITSLTAWGVKGKFSGLLRLSGGDEVI